MDTGNSHCAVAKRRPRHHSAPTHSLTRHEDSSNDRYTITTLDGETFKVRVANLRPGRATESRRATKVADKGKGKKGRKGKSKAAATAPAKGKAAATAPAKGKAAAPARAAAPAAAEEYDPAEFQKPHPADAGRSAQLPPAKGSTSKGKGANAPTHDCFLCHAEGATRKCSQCKLAWYCDEECFRLDWYVGVRLGFGLRARA